MYAAFPFFLRSVTTSPFADSQDSASQAPVEFPSTARPRCAEQPLSLPRTGLHANRDLEATGHPYLSFETSVPSECPEECGRMRGHQQSALRFLCPAPPRQLSTESSTECCLPCA